MYHPKELPDDESQLDATPPTALCENGTGQLGYHAIRHVLECLLSTSAPTLRLC